MRETFYKRVGIVKWCFILALCYCMYHLVKLAFIERGRYNGSPNIYQTYDLATYDTLDSAAKANCILEYDIMPSRGIIFAEQNRPLVSNIRVFPIGIDGVAFDPNHTYFKSNEPYLDTLINDLALNFYKIFHDRYPNMKVENYRNKIGHALKDRVFVQIFSEEKVVQERHMVLEKDIKALCKLPVLSRTIEEDLRARYGFTEAWMERHNIKRLRFNKILNTGSGTLQVRVHPYGSLAMRILGNTERQNGIDGCARFNPILTGKAGHVRKLFIDGLSVPLERENPYTNGGNVYTTINVDIQEIVHKELLASAKRIKPMWACAIVMETATGDIKALSNFTRYINEATGDTIYKEERNNAMVAESAEPGSTFKLASLLAYLEQLKGDTSRRYSINVHTFNVHGRNYRKRDSERAEAKGEQTGISPKEIIQRSSNVGIAMMMRDAFPSYQDYAARLDSLYITLGFSAQIGNLNPINMRANTKNFHEQYGNYFGAGFYMQPMQTLVYYNAVANGGKMVQPRFVRATKSGNTITEYPVKVLKEQIASPKTIAIAQSILRSVVMEKPGTAHHFADESLPFAGKTGTRDIYDRNIGSYDKNRNSISFCGYFPADKPQYSCIVYMFNVGTGSGEAVRVFSKICHQIMNPPIPIPDTTYYGLTSTPIRTKAFHAIKTHWMQQSVPVPNSTYCVILNDKLNNVAPYTPTIKNNMPNVIGLPASEALCELKKYGFVVQLTGIGIVKKQTYNPLYNTVTLILSTG